jgi:hypothetical protein
MDIKFSVLVLVRDSDSVFLKLMYKFSKDVHILLVYSNYPCTFFGCKLPQMAKLRMIFYCEFFALLTLAKQGKQIIGLLLVEPGCKG